MRVGARDANSGGGHAETVAPWWGAAHPERRRWRQIREMCGKNWSWDLAD
jgi:hypothetical protein